MPWQFAETLLVVCQWTVLFYQRSIKTAREAWYQAAVVDAGLTTQEWRKHYISQTSKIRDYLNWKTTSVSLRSLMLLPLLFVMYPTLDWNVSEKTYTKILAKLQEGGVSPSKPLLRLWVYMFSVDGSERTSDLW